MVMRDPAGGASPRRYLPVSQPPASGLNGVKPSPRSAQSGRTSRSAPRSSSEYSFWTQPNSWHHFMADHIVTFTVLPIAVDKTLVRTTWLVHKDAVEGVDYDVANLKAVWEATNEQDRRLVEEAQIGVASGAYEPGPYSPFTEELVEKFDNWYVERLRACSAA